jgi:hypothetical protein
MGIVENKIAFLSFSGQMKTSASIKNAKKAANGDWHEEEEGC